MLWADEGTHQHSPVRTTCMALVQASSTSHLSSAAQMHNACAMKVGLFTPTSKGRMTATSISVRCSVDALASVV